MDLNLERQYEENRAKMVRCERAFDRIFWGMILLGGMLFVLALYVSGDVGRDPSVEATDKFYLGMLMGGLQMLAAGTTIGFAFGIRAKKPLAMIFFAALALLWMLLSLLDVLRLSIGNFLFGAAGLTLCLFALRQYKIVSYLMDQPGYPLFSLRADTPAEYIPPAYVHANQPRGHMDAIGSTAQNSPAPDAIAPLDVAGAMLGNASAPSPAVHAADSTLRESLTAFSPDAAAASPIALPQPDSLPQVSAADLLADMTAEPRHAPVQEALPDPEEVRARLRRMQAERNAVQGEPKFR